MPLKQAVEYVAAAYIFVFVLLLVYLLIMSKRLRSVQREMGSLRALAQLKLSSMQAEPPSAQAPRTEDGHENGAIAATARTATEGDLGRPESSVA